MGEIFNLSQIIAVIKQHINTNTVLETAHIKRVESNEK